MTGQQGEGLVQLTMFEMKDDVLREEIRKLDIEKTTPLEALHTLSELKKQIEKKGKE